MHVSFFTAMLENEMIPPEYTQHVIEEVRFESDAIVISYSGKIFGGIMPDLLAPGVAESIQKGARIFVRLHDAETGWPGQVAHVIMRWDGGEGWAELYSNL